MFEDPFDCEGILVHNIIICMSSSVKASLEYTSLFPCLCPCALFQAENKGKESKIGVRRERIHTIKGMCFDYES